MAYVRDSTTIPFVYKKNNPDTGAPFTNTDITACTVRLLDIATGTELVAATSMTWDATLQGYRAALSYSGNARYVMAVMTPTRAGGISAALTPIDSEVLDLADTLERIDETAGVLITERGTAQGGAAASITLAAGASATNSIYNGRVLVITGGTGVGQARVISGYTGSSKAATVNRNWQTNPDTTSTYAILGIDLPITDSSLFVGIQNAHRPTGHSGTAQGGAASTITLTSTASAVTDFYKGQVIHLTGGTGQDQSRVIIAYNGTSKIATVSRAWATNPDSTTTYSIMRGQEPDMNANLEVFADRVAEIETALATHDTDIKTRLTGIEGTGFVSATDSLAASQDEHDATQSKIDSLTMGRNTAFVMPADLYVPASGNNVYDVYLRIYNDDGILVAPDALPTFQFIGGAGTGPTGVTLGAVVADGGTGKYKSTITVNFAASPEVAFTVNMSYTRTDGGVTKTYENIGMGTLVRDDASHDEIYADTQAILSRIGTASDGTGVTTVFGKINRANGTLEHATYGLAALDTDINSVLSELANGTYGLSALNADIDNILTRLGVDAGSVSLHDKIGAFTATNNLKALLGPLDTTNTLKAILGGFTSTNTLKYGIEVIQGNL